jgi:hypothetical protein
MATNNIADVINRLSKEIAILLVSLAVLHAVATPSVFSLVVLLGTAVVCGVGFGYFRDSSYDVREGVLVGTAYAVLFLILAPLLVVDAFYCSTSMTGGFLFGCANPVAGYTGAALAVGTIGFVGQLLNQR